MTIQDLINKKNYDYISYRVIHTEVPEGVFAGVCHSKDGKLISNDGDYYSTNEEIISYEEWNNPEEGIKNGLNVWIGR